MEENQRQAHYNAWKNGKKWVDIEVKQIDDGDWMATPITRNIGDPDMVVYRETKVQAIYAIQGQLSAKGFEISNLAKVQGII